MIAFQKHFQKFSELPNICRKDIFKTLRLLANSSKEQLDWSFG